MGKDGARIAAQEEAGSERYAGSRPRRGPLSGIRIADFCWMGVGSLATRFLADMGAEVIKIEHPSRIDLMRRHPIYKNNARTVGEHDPRASPDASGMHNNYSRNKLGVTINMRTPAGRAMAERLISVSNLVTENFAPGVMEGWGFDFDRLSELSPNVIYARMSGFGHSGPYESYRSYGPVVQAMSGLSFISGLPGREPSGWGLSYMDNQAAYYNTNALLMAIYQRELTGQGCEIDVSAVDAGVSLVGPLLLDVSANGRKTRGPDFPMGNRPIYGDAAPHGVYPAKGEDRWIAIAIETDAEWKALCLALDAREWLEDERLAVTAGRVEHIDELDEMLSQKTRIEEAHALMHRLQAAGVMAAAVQDEEDIVDHDPQLRERDVFFTLDHPVIGPAQFEGIPIRFSKGGAINWRSAPLLGEDNDYVFRELVGLSEEEYALAKEEDAF
jgi:crotonobetainyl-CoA:carnitine CoA-transferase CaiB-like acyl-CoA transferase